MSSSTGRLLVLNGPNLNLLGRREPEIYGTASLDEVLARARRRAATLGYELVHLQSNAEAELIDAIHHAAGEVDGLILNAGALTHTSWAIADAIAGVELPTVEVHLSNPAAREPFRHTSVLAAVVVGSIAGFGGLSYELAVVSLAEILQQRATAGP